MNFLDIQSYFVSFNFSFYTITMLKSLVYINSKLQTDSTLTNLKGFVELFSMYFTNFFIYPFDLS